MYGTPSSHGSCPPGNQNFKPSQPRISTSQPTSNSFFPLPFERLLVATSAAVKTLLPPTRSTGKSVLASRRQSAAHPKEKLSSK